VQNRLNPVEDAHCRQLGRIYPGDPVSLSRVRTRLRGAATGGRVFVENVCDVWIEAG
jgi:hypothetical protein